MRNVQLPPRLLRTPEAARFVGLSARTMEKHRIYGTGPCYRKLGGRVVYAIEDLQAWCDQGLKSSTSDPGCGEVLPPRPEWAAPDVLDRLGRRAESRRSQQAVADRR